MKSRITEEQIQLLKDELCIELADHLMEKYNYSPQEAIDILYTSETFDRLQNTKTGFYYQSAGYISTFLDNEIMHGVFA